MKYNLVYIITLLSLVTAINYIHSCPTCVGRVTKQDPPFFSAAFEQKRLKQHAPQQKIASVENHSKKKEIK